MKKSWIIAISGASGSIYGRRLIEAILELSPTHQVEVIVSEAALRVMREEENRAVSIGKLSAEQLIGKADERIIVHSNRNIGASIASGSYPVEGMAICPCSMNTLAAVAHGISENLIQRAADVTLKEGRRLILVPRETPLSAIHLENMLTLNRAGARIVPAMPGFYHEPKSIAELVDMMVMKILDQMGIESELVSRWGKADNNNERIEQC